MLHTRAYSRKYQQLEREQLLQVKDDLAASSRSSRVRAQLLSKQTEQRRRALEEKKLAMARSEENRRRKALEERRRSQQEATNRFRNAIYKLKQVPRQHSVGHGPNRQCLPVEIYLPNKPMKAQPSSSAPSQDGYDPPTSATPTTTSERVAFGKTVEVKCKRERERDGRTPPPPCLDDVLDTIRGQGTGSHVAAPPSSQSVGSLSKHHQHHHSNRHRSNPELRSSTPVMIRHSTTRPHSSSNTPHPTHEMMFVPVDTAHSRSHTHDSLHPSSTSPSPSYTPPVSPVPSNHSSSSSSLQDSLDGSANTDTRTSELTEEFSNPFFQSATFEEKNARVETDASVSNSDSLNITSLDNSPRTSEGDGGGREMFSRLVDTHQFVAVEDKSLVLEDEEDNSVHERVDKKSSSTTQQPDDDTITNPSQQQQQPQQQQFKPKMPVSILKKPSATSTPIDSVPSSASTRRTLGYIDDSPGSSKQGSAKHVRFIDDPQYGRKKHSNYTHDPLSSRDGTGETRTNLAPKMKILLTNRTGSGLLSQRQQQQQQRHLLRKNGIVVPVANLATETSSRSQPQTDELSTTWPQARHGVQYVHQSTKLSYQDAPKTHAQSSNTGTQSTADHREGARHASSHSLPSSPPCLSETPAGQEHTHIPPIDINTSIALDRTPSDEDIGRLWNEITSYFQPSHHRNHHHHPHSGVHRGTNKQYEVLPVTYPQSGSHDNQAYLLLPKSLSQGLHHSRAHSASNVRDLDSSATQQKLAGSRPMRCYSVHQPVQLWKKQYPPGDGHSDRLVELTTTHPSGRQSPARGVQTTRQGSMSELSAEEKKLLESIELLNHRLRGRVSAEAMVSSGPTPVPGPEFEIMEGGSGHISAAANRNNNNNTEYYPSSGTTRNRSLTVLPRTRVRRHPRTAAVLSAGTTTNTMSDPTPKSRSTNTSHVHHHCDHRTEHHYT